MCLTAWNSLRPPKSPIMSRTGPTSFDAWSSWGGRPKQTPRSHPRVLGRHVVSWKEGLVPFMPTHTRTGVLGAGVGVVRAPGCTPQSHK